MDLKEVGRGLDAFYCG